MASTSIRRRRPAISTERLRLTARCLDDLEDCLRMDLDARVTRFAFSTINEHAHRERIRQAICEDVNPDYGFWVARTMDTGSFAGWVYLKPFDGPYPFELGYRFRYEVWGQGLAREAASAVVHYALSSLDADHICAVTNPENERSIALLKRLGFRGDGVVEAYGSLASLYMLRAD